MSLTPEDIATLEAPLPLEHHEARAKGKNKAGTQQQWLIYITQEGVIPLLNSIDPSWTWEVRESSKWDKYAVVTGRLTIKDVFRDGRGGNSPNSASASTDEDTEKGAETDALKRAAVKFGVGLYLRGVPPIWLPYSDSNKSWEDEQKALAEFAKWYKREFGQQAAQNGRSTQPPPPRQPNAPAPAGGAQPSPLATASPSSTASSSAQGGSPEPPAGGNGKVEGEHPQIGSLNMKALFDRCGKAGLVGVRAHFDNLIRKLKVDDAVRDDMTADDVFAVIQQYYAAKEGVGAR